MPSTQQTAPNSTPFECKHYLRDVQEFIQFWRAREAIFGWNDFVAIDVIDPVNLGEGIIVFPPHWTDSQRANWRTANGLAIPDEFRRTPAEFRRTGQLDFG